MPKLNAKTIGQCERNRRDPDWSRTPYSEAREYDRQAIALGRMLGIVEQASHDWDVGAITAEEALQHIADEMELIKAERDAA